MLILQGQLTQPLEVEYCCLVVPICRDFKKGGEIGLMEGAYLGPANRLLQVKDIFETELQHLLNEVDSDILHIVHADLQPLACEVLEVLLFLWINLQSQKNLFA